MGKSSKPKIKQVDPRTSEQKSISSMLSQLLQERSGMQPPSGEDIDLALMGESWTKGVAAPMIQAFETYGIPAITSGFRRGGLFSKARGDAISRSLEGLMGGLTSELASRNWAATMAKAQMLERPYYESPAWAKESLAFLGTPGLETVGIQGQAGPDWLGGAATLGGAYLGSKTGSKAITNWLF